MDVLRLRASRVAFVSALAFASGLARAEPTAAPAPPSREARTAAPDPVLRPIVTPRLAREAIAVALRVVGHPAVRRALASLAERARSASALPEVWLRGSHSTDDALRLTPTAGDPYGYSQSGGIGWLFEARLIWHLDRLVFDRDEISVERLRAEREGDAAKLANRVVETLFAWQRAALRAGDPKATSDEQTAAALSKSEAEVVLDVLTDGWFSARAEASPGRAEP